MEDITNTQEVRTQDTQVVDEQNTNELANTEVQQETIQENEAVVPPVENSNNDSNEQVDTKQQELTNEELKAKLKEYEVRDEENRLLREKLGIPEDIDRQQYEFMSIEEQINNYGKTEYLKLCTQYGVDADPRNVNKSVEDLKTNDPAKYYEFIRSAENLANYISNQKQQVQQQVANYEYGKFANDYHQLLEASPALNNIVNQYIYSYGGQGGSLYDQLANVMNIILPAYSEAFEAGKRLAMGDVAKKDTTPVSGGIATATSQPYQQGQYFTREQISKMSPEEFAKNEKAIYAQMKEGKIQ